MLSTMAIYFVFTFQTKKHMRYHMAGVRCRYIIGLKGIYKYKAE